jgi:photosystem II stability/assembly factor-like uncharacterized protein
MIPSLTIQTWFTVWRIHLDRIIIIMKMQAARPNVIQNSLKWLMALLIFSPCIALAQMFTQVYPENEISPISAAVHWNGDTMILGGYAGLIMRSTDAGRTWEDLRPAGRDWNFHNAARTNHGIFLLAEPTVWNSYALPEGHRSALVKYDPRTNSLDLVGIPALQSTDSSFLTICDQYEIAGTDYALFLFQGSIQKGMSLHRTCDGGESWMELPLPDSTFAWDDKYIASYDSLHVALRFRSRIDNVSGQRLFATSDAGKSWNHSQGITIDGKASRNKYQRANFAWLSADELIAFTNQGEVVVTTNAGQTWSHRGYPPFLNIVKIDAQGDGRGYVLADQHVYRTDDGFKSFLAILPDRYLNYFCVAGKDTLVVWQNNDNILVSHNGGVSWDAIRSNPIIFEAIRMSSDLAGIALTFNDQGDYKYYLTHDGWETMRYLMDETSFAGELCRIFPVADNLWYRIEGKVLESGSIIKITTDEGSSWTTVLERTDIPGLKTDALIRISILDTSNIGFFIDRMLYFSSDRGASWRTISFPVHWSSFQTTLVPNGPSWLLVRPNGARPRIDTVFYNTGDWTTWVPVLTEPDTGAGISDSYLLSMRVTQKNECMVYAQEDRYIPGVGISPKSSIFFSTDTGRTWEKYPQAPGSRGAMFLQDGSAISNSESAGRYSSFTGGQSIMRSTDNWKTSHIEDYRYSESEALTTGGRNALYLVGYGNIHRNLTGGINGVDRPDALPSQLRIHSPFPHPIVNGGVVEIPIEFASGGSRKLNVALMDLLGRTLRILSSEDVEGDRITVPWSVTGIPAGVYVIRVQAGDAVTIRPVIVQ